MPSAALLDPLWWVAARLRRILTGLLMLALALGAAAEVRAAADGRSAEAQPAAFTLVSAAAPAPVASFPLGESASTGPVGLSSPPIAADLRGHLGSADAVGADSWHQPEIVTGPAAERSNIADQVHPFLLPADLIPARTAANPDELPGHARRPAPLGQRAPPAA